MIVRQWEHISLSQPRSPGRLSIQPLPLLLMLYYNLLFKLFSFIGQIQSVQWLHWILFLGDGRSCMRCVVLTCLLYRFMQAALEVSEESNGMPLLSAWCGIGRLFTG
jgi:hypothetical protein